MRGRRRGSCRHAHGIEEVAAGHPEAVSARLGLTGLRGTTDEAWRQERDSATIRVEGIRVAMRIEMASNEAACFGSGKQGGMDDSAAGRCLGRSRRSEPT